MASRALIVWNVLRSLSIVSCSRVEPGRMYTGVLGAAIVVINLAKKVLSACIRLLEGDVDNSS